MLFANAKANAKAKAKANAKAIRSRTSPQP